jgi:hypothetical protein
MRRGCTKCVGYLPDQPFQALNINARVMHGATLAFVLLGSSYIVFPWDQGALYECWGYCKLLLGIPCKRLVNNKYSRNV